MSKAISRHYEKIWKFIILQVLDVVREELDTEFVNGCNVRFNDQDAWKKELEREYRKLRRDLKKLCYGNNADEGLLDGRKVAAIFCKALINKKVCAFDTSKAYSLLQIRRKELSPEALNLWISHNIFVNYKFAYYVSLQLVFFTLLNDLLSSTEDQKYAIALNNLGHLYNYPRIAGTDSFDVNIIIGLARIDIAGGDFDMFMYAMQLYQIEMYTIEKLKHNIE